MHAHAQLHAYICTWVCHGIQVPLGVTVENENTLQGITHILHELHHYVPAHRLDNGDVQADIVHCILVGGDQVTRKRAAEAQTSMANALIPQQQLCGLVPVVEDWHARHCLLCVSLYACTKTTQF